ncbi:MAG: DUF3445 domain-containing protein [Pseudomonadota bacterium]
MTQALQPEEPQAPLPLSVPVPVPAAAARPILLAPAPHLPFLDKRTAHPPGVQPLASQDWIVVEGDFAEQMAAREALISTRPEIVLAALPEAEMAMQELLAEVLAHLDAQPRYRVEGAEVRRPDGATVIVDGAAPMASIGRLVADDFCLLLPDAASGEYRLVAAVLCFPARWSLAEKMGKPLTAIHAPVPNYAEGLSRRVNRLFDAIRPERPLWRANWLVYGDPVLHQPALTAEDGPAPTEGKRWSPNGPFYLRVERQTLRRLPVSGAVAFGIKSSVTPVEALRAEDAAVLSRELAGLHEAEIAYRIGEEAAKAIRARLDALAAAG